MIYHKNLKQITDFVRCLDFIEKAKLEELYESNLSTPFECSLYLECNGLKLIEFKENLISKRQTVFTILAGQFQDEPALRVDYVETLCSLDRLIHDLYNGNEFIGKKSMKKYQFDSAAFEQGSLTISKFNQRKHEINDFTEVLFDELNELKSILTNFLLQDKKSTPKLKWKCSATPLGTLFSELYLKGWIDIPLTSGEPSYEKLAKYLSLYFQFEGRNENGSERSLKNVLNGQYQMSKAKRDSIKLPHISDIL